MMMFEAIRDRDMQVMFFVGNRSCIEVHSGPMKDLRQMGPWLNVLDEGFNLHLCGDHLAEIRAVEKPTRRGPALSVEAFDSDGELIFQCFGMRQERNGDPEAWASLVAELPGEEGA
ncbi:ChuX/HutX family heme-like substrate-binding protein [Paracoccus seriniphilus]|uniref:Haemin-degrading HemS.ChuX domain-containing protein n=1 Tax=Paracoccus seriniphilus TaxID=184748 RepID=A0A239Q0S4_9RHOB|nr:ChuX/HutX family heme-like substrate-binding protein [Paracoccus seriniphilus]SNT76199.1 Haemin-degrading HemS.ChuX domain-containing protein [Paracoccus seriniphilus]